MPELNLDVGGAIVLYVDRELLKSKGFSGTALSHLRDNLLQAPETNLDCWTLGFTV